MQNKKNIIINKNNINKNLKQNHTKLVNKTKNNINKSLKKNNRRLVNKTKVNKKNSIPPKIKIERIVKTITKNNKKIKKVILRRVIDNSNTFTNNNVDKDYNINIKIIDLDNQEIDTKLGFIMVRYVNNLLTGNYWKESYNSIREFYPTNKILIIDDNSNYNFIKKDDEDKLQNCEIIKSEFPRRGELLPYYYFYKTKFAEKAVIIHDSVFINQYIDFNEDINVKFLWNFDNHSENSNLESKFLNSLNNNSTLLNTYNSRNWKGCFGVMSVIKLSFIIMLVEKYDFFKLLNYINNRVTRCCLERVFSIICHTENNNVPSYFDNIYKYCQWGYTFASYIQNKQNKQNRVIKVWTGR